MAVGTEAPAADADLVARARERDADAWDELCVRLYPRLLAYASRRIGVDAARDAVSETFARAVTDIARYEARRGCFDGWVFGICRHVVVARQREDGRRSSRPLPDRASPDPGPADHVLAREEHAALRAAFDRLSPGDQELLELRVLGHLSAEEVARVLRKRPGAVRTAQSRALSRLRAHLEEVTP